MSGSSRRRPTHGPPPYDPYDEQWTGVPLHRVVFGELTSGVNKARVEVCWLDSDVNGPRVGIGAYEMDAATASQVSEWLAQAAAVCD